MKNHVQKKIRYPSPSAADYLAIYDEIEQMKVLTPEQYRIWPLCE